MNKLTIVLIIIAILSVASIAFAIGWQRTVLIDVNEQAFGTASNPIYVQGV